MLTVFLLETKNIKYSDFKFNKNTHVTQQSISSLICHKFLSAKLSELFGIKPQDSEIVTNPNGKPYLKNFKNIHFNISHTSDFAAIAIADCEIGIDIEAIRDVNLKICERFFTQNEFNYINENKSMQTERFFEIWTKKEAYIKQKGLILSLISKVDVTDLDFFTTKVNNVYLSVFTENQENPEIKTFNRSKILEIIN